MKRQVFKKPTFHCHLFGLSIYAPYFYDRNSTHNKLAALLNRAGRFHEHELVFTLEEEAYIFEFLSFLHPVDGEITLQHAESYIAAKTWPSHKKKNWMAKTREFIDTVRDRPEIDLYFKYGAFHDLFIKDESYSEPYKAPRMIFDAQASIKAAGALKLERLAEQFFHSKYSVKHKTMDERVEEIKRRSLGFKFFVRMDYSSYESSISAKAQEFEWRIYEHFGVSIGPMKALASSPTQILCDRSFRAVISTCRMSGDFNTSLGNSILNLAAIAVCCHRLNLHFDVIVEGDDALLMTREDPSGLKDLLYRKGLDADFQVFSQPGMAGFCGLRFDESGRYFDQIKIFRHLLVSHPNSLSLEDYKKAVIRSALDLDPTNPVLHELHRRHPSNFKAAWDMGEGVDGEYVGGFYLVRAGQIERPSFMSYQYRWGIPEQDLRRLFRLPDLEMIETVLYMLGESPLPEIRQIEFNE